MATIKKSRKGTAQGRTHGNRKGSKSVATKGIQAHGTTGYSIAEDRAQAIKRATLSAIRLHKDALKELERF